MNISIKFYIAVVIYSMYACDGRPSIVKCFSSEKEALDFIKEKQKEFADDYGVPTYYHDYDESETVYYDVQRAYQKWKKYKKNPITDYDMLVAETSNTDRMFARVECNEL